ncbi:heme peroxidase [Zopfochytrium polystomum]|nr:heme peroxidase [Zopfochytrium polystomum]
MTADQWAELRLDLNKVFAWAPSPRELAANAFPYGSGIVRLSWHDAGSANVETGTGGPHGDLRFSQVYSYSENLGLQRAVDILEPIYQKFNGSISHADLWSFAAAVFITNNNGPEIAWRPGRADAPSFAADPIPPFTHPNATMDASDYRPIFQRMGFNDREIVALIGAHNIGWASKNNSDYVGGWTTEPWWFSNQFFTRLLLVDTAFYTATTNDGQICCSGKTQTSS